MPFRSPFDHALRASRLIGRTERVPSADPLGWLATRPHPRFYWHDRAEGVAWAGSGIALEVASDGAGAIAKAAAQVRHLLERVESDLVPPRVFGGGAFDPREAAARRWSGFPGARFVLPRVLLRSDAAGCFATAWGSAEEDLGDLIDEARASAAAARGRRRHADAQRLVDPEAWAFWQERVEGALAAIAAAEVRKVVLARAIACGSSEPFDAAVVLSALEERSERSTPFLIDFGEGASFAGASPELLLRVRGGMVETECIAGTTARGATVEEDKARAAEVLGSEKDRREHDHVVEAVMEAYGSFCSNVIVDRIPVLLSLSAVHHLRVGVRGRLLPEKRFEDLLGALHPTPAVGGSPRDRALDLLRRLEGSSRGWYAGPVGWIEPDAAEFAVAIRSALMNGAHAWAFAGSGIVQGSDPRGEWEETEAKAGPMIGALTGGGI